MESVLSFPSIDERTSLVRDKCSQDMGKAQAHPSSERQAIDEETALRRKRLFDKYVMPYNRMIYKLVMNYTTEAQHVESNYYDVLANMYKYIETYDPTRPIHAWLHIITKRYVFDLNKKRSKKQSLYDYKVDVGGYCNHFKDIEVRETANTLTIDNYRELYNDDILYALDQLKEPYRRCLILQQASYKLKEIAEIEFNYGTLESKNIETVKSRLFLARQQLQQLLTRDGKRRISEEEDTDGLY